MGLTDIYFGLGLSILILISAAVAVYIFTKQQRGHSDTDVSTTRVKRNILANPIFWLYILFPIAIFVGTWIVYAWD